MKRSGRNRLLTPFEMEELKMAGLDRDESCVGAIAFSDHICTDRLGRQVEPTYHKYLDFDHWLEQSWIKNYYNLGGARESDGFWTPIKPHERGLIEPGITANEIARDVRTGMTLCQGLHAQRPGLPFGKVVELARAVPGWGGDLQAAAQDYTMLKYLDRAFDYRWDEVLAQGQ